MYGDRDELGKKISSMNEYTPISMGLQMNEMKLGSVAFAVETQ